MQFDEVLTTRMLNALEPGTVLPIHRHRNTSETVVIIRDSLVERFYDDEGKLTEEVLMVPGGENPAVQIEKGRWHSLECLEPGTVLFEAKDGAWEPLGDEDIIKVNGGNEVSQSQEATKPNGRMKKYKISEN